MEGGVPSLSAAETLWAGPLRLDRVARRAWLREGELTLTPKAMLVLDYLATHPDELISRERLLEVLWGLDFPVVAPTLDSRIAELRRALGDDAVRPAWIEMVSNQGYRFVAPVEPADARSYPGWARARPS
jgi:DNA-binding response OmpR family regulator